ncbi:hypothetical protein BJ742DRAFT_839107 [Cladochytrium replicatum]|nr:hypothetical protein BJ742DRAFT_839107 [Cladochytrium replicatum]
MIRVAGDWIAHVTLLRMAEVQLPNKHTQKYDRQLRLWQAHGQAALEGTKLCLINASACGTETLKNLVLPGVGSFTIVDGETVTGADVGSNFFLTVNSIGQSRAKATTELLQELNEDVSGYHLFEDPAELIAKKPDFFTQFSIVVACNLTETPLVELSEILWKAGIPLVVVRSYGFIGYLRICVPEHALVETHPEQIIDLRLDCPFPALQQLASQYDFATMDSFARSHVPYVIILLKCLEEWKSTHGGLPPTSSERNAFKELIKSKAGADNSDQENFDEALAAAYRAQAVTKVPDSVRKILNDPHCEVTSKSSNFWIIARALRDFVANEGGGLLPLAGPVPDMKADTTSFVNLQTVYRSKALADAAAVRSRVQSLLQTLQKPSDSISSEEIDRFCKNSQYLTLIRYRNLAEEYIKPATNDIGYRLDQDSDDVIYYILLRAVDKFYTTHNRYPGALEDDVDDDIGHLKKTVIGLLNSWDLSGSSIDDDHIHEMVRAGASELHSIAAIMGGIASQEIIKVITKQYVPLDNTVIFNGVKSTSAAFKF